MRSVFDVRSREAAKYHSPGPQARDGSESESALEGRQKMLGVGRKL
jgi:hypothetical protein